MSRTKTFKLVTAAQRRNIKPDHAPYFVQLYKGLHLGFYKAAGTKAESWVARVRINKKYQYAALGAVTKAFGYKEAERAAKEFESQLESGKNPKAQRKSASMTVADLVEEYIAKTAPKKKSADWVYQSTRRAKAYIYAYDIGGVHLDLLTAADIDDLQSELLAKMTPESVNRNLAGLRAALNWAHKRDMIADTPWKKVSLLKEVDAREKKRIKKYFNKEERLAFVEDMPKDLKAICTFMMYTGCRPSEARGLQVSDVDLKAKAVWLKTLKGNGGETYNYREFPLYRGLIPLLKGLTKGKAESDLVFPTQNGLPWAMANLAKAINTHKTEHKHDPKWESYCFRHGILTDWINAGIPAMNVAKIAGTSTKFLEQNYHRKDSTLADQLGAVP